jgi:hypothetical protein
LATHFKFSHIFLSYGVVVVDLKNKLSDNIAQIINFAICSDISTQPSLYILYNIDAVEVNFSILIFIGYELEIITLW